MRKFIAGYIFTGLALAFAWPCTAQVPKLQKAIHTLKGRPGMEHATVAVCIKNTASGEVIFEDNDTSKLAPASCLKIPTTGAALGTLGADFRFCTTVAYKGTLDANGALTGDVVIYGGGDPTLGSARFDSPVVISSFAAAIRAAGIKKINGTLIINAAYFGMENLCPTWAWDDIGNYFGAGVSSLNYNENRYFVKLQAGAKPGDKVKLLGCTPQNLGLGFENRLLTGAPGSGDESNIFGLPDDDCRVLDGTIQPSRSPFTIKGAMPNPMEWFARTLADTLARAGMLADDHEWKVLPVATEDARQPVVIQKFYSPPLKDVVYHTNQASINLYAECLLKQMALEQKMCTRGMGARVVKSYWAKQGLDTIGWVMHDGSGLSKDDRISARQMADMLCLIKKQQWFDIFLGSLPLSGRDGAMKGMAKGKTGKVKVYAKTGHLTGVRAYCGYMKKEDGQWLSFAIIINDYTMTSGEIHDEIEKLIIAMAGIS